MKLEQISKILEERIKNEKDVIQYDVRDMDYAEVEKVYDLIIENLENLKNLDVASKLLAKNLLSSVEDLKDSALEYNEGVLDLENAGYSDDEENAAEARDYLANKAFEINPKIQIVESELTALEVSYKKNQKNKSKRKPS